MIPIDNITIVHIFIYFPLIFVAASFIVSTKRVSVRSYFSLALAGRISVYHLVLIFVCQWGMIMSTVAVPSENTRIFSYWSVNGSYGFVSDVYCVGCVVCRIVNADKAFNSNLPAIVSQRIIIENLSTITPTHRYIPLCPSICIIMVIQSLNSTVQ